MCLQIAKGMGVPNKYESDSQRSCRQELHVRSACQRSYGLNIRHVGVIINFKD